MMRAGRERKLVTVGLLLGSFVAAFEATAVATAMPTAIADLGGVARYSWVFSAYLLTSTTTVPMYGKLADLYGRQKVYIISTLLFIAGSALSGAAGTMNQLILYRAIQGLGAGGMQPISMTVVGDIYTLEERGRMQGVFSAVWGISSIVGPALGGIITDVLSWRWIFYINVPFGIASAVLIKIYLAEKTSRREHALDIIGTVSLTAAITLLLVALLEGSQDWGWSSAPTLLSLLASAIGLGVFFWQEKRAPEPMLPLDLFRSRIIAVGSAGSAVVGTLLLTVSAYVPMFVQGVLGGSATAAGAALGPMMLGWPIASTIAGWLLLRAGYRRLVILGGAVAVVASLLLLGLGPNASRGMVMIVMAIMGAGLGFMATPYLVAVQNAVPWQRRGVATSATQFFRTIGGAIAVAAFGAVLNSALAPVLSAGVSVNAALEPSLRARLSPAELDRLVAALLSGLHSIFLGFAVVAAAGLVAGFFFPSGTAQSLAHEEAGSSGPSPAPMH